MNKKVCAMITTLLALGMVGCSSPTNTKNEEVDYLRCNATSTGNMVETESGFFYETEGYVYYADKQDMNTWVPLCNKADCMHNASDDCNAVIENEIFQKNDKIYYMKASDGAIMDRFFIMELLQDGSGSKSVLEIPLREGSIHSTRSIVSQEQCLIYYSYLKEDGMFQRKIGRVEEDGTLYTLFSEELESISSQITLPSYHNRVQGDFTIVSSLLVEEGENHFNILWRVDGEKPERVNLPEDVSVLRSYLTENTFTYYKEKEGFFEIDLESGKEKLLSPNQLEDGRGYVLTEDYMIECNRYRDYKPEEAYLKFFNGEKWIDIALPKEIQELDCAFYPASVASDRIFMIQDYNGANRYASQLYYFMLEEENPELILCKTFGYSGYFEVSETEEEQEHESFFKEVDVTVFDTEEYLVKVTGIGPSADDKSKEKYEIQFYCENRTSDKDFQFIVDDITINGVQNNFRKSVSVEAGEVKEEKLLTEKKYLELEGIYTESNMRDFTNIGISIYVMDGDKEYSVVDDMKDIKKTIVSVYPYGEEEATVSVREPLDTDVVLVENEYITVTAINWFKYEIENDGIQLLIENKTDERIMFMVEKLLSVNDIEVEEADWEPAYDDNSNQVVLPNSVMYCRSKIQPEFLAENGIETIEEYKLGLRAYYSDNFQIQIGDEVLNETVTITP